MEWNLIESKQTADAKAHKARGRKCGPRNRTGGAVEGEKAIQPGKRRNASFTYSAFQGAPPNESRPNGKPIPYYYFFFSNICLTFTLSYRLQMDWSRSNGFVM